VTPGNCRGSPIPAVQWLSDDREITGATEIVYVPADADNGWLLSAR
jgi:hypothetical protein